VTVESLPLSKIEMDPAVNIRDQLDEETIQWYMSIIDDLPPVVVYNWNGTHLLADGFHRYAAADRLGRRELKAEIRRGSKDDAWIFAAVANFRHGHNLTLLERDRAIERVYSLRPDWGVRQVAKEFGLKAHKTVEDAIHAVRLRRDLQSGDQGRQPVAYKERNLVIAARSPDVETAGKLLERGEKEGWTRDELQAAVRTVNDPKLSDEYKQQVITGQAPPILAGNRVLEGSIERMVSQAKKYDTVGALWTVVNAIANLRQIGVDGLSEQASSKDAQSLLRFLSDDISLLKQAKAALEKVR
jgi:ParB-like chromosome segregation protein Spo0J